MRTSERLAVYAALAAALLLSLSSFTGGSAARATPARGTAPGEVRLATIDVLKIMELLLGGDRYRPAIDAKQSEIRAKIESMSNEGKAVEAALKALPPDSADRQTLLNDLQSRQADLQTYYQAASAELQSLTMQQISEAYRLTIEAASSVAKGKGFTHVLATRSGALEFRTNSPDGAFQEMLLRPLVVGVEGDDITADVMTHLKLEEPRPAVIPGANPAAIPPAAPVK